MRLLLSEWQGDTPALVTLIPIDGHTVIIRIKPSGYFNVDDVHKKSLKGWISKNMELTVWKPRLVALRKLLVTQNAKPGTEVNWTDKWSVGAPAVAPVAKQPAPKIAKPDTGLKAQSLL